MVEQDKNIIKNEVIGQEEKQNVKGRQEGTLQLERTGSIWQWSSKFPALLYRQGLIVRQNEVTASGIQYGIRFCSVL